MIFTRAGAFLPVGAKSKQNKALYLQVQYARLTKARSGVSFPSALALGPSVADTADTHRKFHESFSHVSDVKNVKS